MIIGLLIGFAVGVLVASWHYHITRSALVKQAARVARIYAMSTDPIGPELQRLGEIYFRGNQK